METTYTLTQLTFAPDGEFECPRATVVVQLTPRPMPNSPVITLQFTVPGATSGRTPAAIAAAALAQAQALVPASAAANHLLPLAQAWAAEVDAHDAASQAALLAAMDAARQQSGG